MLEQDYITLHLSQNETTMLLDALSKLPLYQSYGFFNRILNQDKLARSVMEQAADEVAITKDGNDE